VATVAAKARAAESKARELEEQLRACQAALAEKEAAVAAAETGRARAEARAAAAEAPEKAKALARAGELEGRARELEEQLRASHAALAEKEAAVAAAETGRARAEARAAAAEAQRTPKVVAVTKHIGATEEPDFERAEQRPVGGLARDKIERARQRALREIEVFGDDEKEHWRANSWADSLEGIGATILGPLLRPLLRGEPQSDHRTHRLQLLFLRSLGAECMEGADAGGVMEVVVELLKSEQVELLHSLAKAISSGLESLATAVAATGQEMHAKFVAEQMPNLTYGKLNAFFEGLVGLIGQPNPSLLEAMAGEHCAGPDGRQMFTTVNYSICTCSLWEWFFVYDPEAGRAQVLPPGTDWPVEKYAAGVSGSVRQYRQPISLSAFEDAWRDKNVRLEAAGAQPLQEVELIGTRLYTGPMFMKYNTALRAKAGEPRSVSQYNMLNRGNGYVTTLHVINSAIVKLGKITAATKVYRGISGRALPPGLAGEDRSGPRGGIELGFMSTTEDKGVAVAYARQKGVIFEMQMGMIDRGANLSWISQYPHEQELLFSPLTGVEVIDLAVEGSILVAKVRLSVNLTTPTIEQVMAKMQSANLQLLDNIRSNVLQAKPPERVLLAIDGLMGTQRAIDPAHFNDASNFQNATKAALAEQREAFKVLSDPQLWDEVAAERESRSSTGGIFSTDEPLSLRIWGAAHVAARMGEHAAAIRLLRLAAQHEAREAEEEVWHSFAAEHGSNSSRPLTAPSPPAPGGRGASARDWSGRGSPVGDGYATLVKEAVSEALSDQSLSYDTFVDLARRLAPSVSDSSLGQMFKECDKNGNGVIDRFEGETLISWILHEQQCSGGNHAIQSTQSRPLFRTQATRARQAQQFRALRNSSRRASLPSGTPRSGTPTPGAERACGAGSQAPLPSSWKEEIDSASGQLYYRNTKNNKITWERPTVDPVVEAALQDARNDVERTDVTLVVKLLELGLPQPWPATLCHLANEIDDAGGGSGDGGRGTALVRDLIKARWSDRMAADEEVLVLVREDSNLWVRAPLAGRGEKGWHVKLEDSDGDGYSDGEDRQFAAPMVLPFDDGGAGALLRAAAAAGRPGLVEALLTAGVYIFEADVDGNTVFHIAAQHGHEGVYRKLMKAAGKDAAAAAFTKNKRGLRAFDCMTTGHHARLTNLLRPDEWAKDSAEARVRDLWKLAGRSTRWRRNAGVQSAEGKALPDPVTALLRAAGPGTVEELAEAIAAMGVASAVDSAIDSTRSEDSLTRPSSSAITERATVDATHTPGGVTALMLALGNDSSHLNFSSELKVRMLLKARANPSLATARGCTALTVAAEIGNERIIRMLLDKGAEVDTAIKTSGMTPLLLACKFGHAAVAEALLASRADVNQVQVGVDEFPPIMYASMYGHSACVDLLIREGAEVNYTKRDGFTALLLAAGFDQLTTVRTLVRAGADLEMGTKIDTKVSRGCTPLLYAAHMGKAAVSRALMQLGADMLHRDKSGCTALHLACKNGHADVVSGLLKGFKAQTFDINVRTNGDGQRNVGLPHGETALHLAVKNGSARVVKLLINAGANQRMRVADGRESPDAFALALAQWRHAPDGGHCFMQVCETLQPTRARMLRFNSLSTDADSFMRARQSLTPADLAALQLDLVRAGVIDESGRLSAGCEEEDIISTFFVRLSSPADTTRQPDLYAENMAMWRENASGRGGCPFLLATWAPRASAGGGSSPPPRRRSASLASEYPAIGDLGVCASLRHRYLLLNGDEAADPQLFNVLVIGKSMALAGDNETEASMSEPSSRGRRIESLDHAIQLVEDMRKEAHAHAERSGWSAKVGLFFEVFPHASLDSLYLHVFDMLEPGTDQPVVLPEGLRSRLLSLDDVLSSLAPPAARRAPHPPRRHSRCV